MADNVLTICQRALGEIGFDVPTFLVSNTDDTATQILYLAQRVGEELMQRFNWSALVVEGATLTMVNGQEVYPLPADFDRLVLNTQWDRTNKWQTMGPDDPATARWRRESINAQYSPRRALRQKGSNLTVWPIPTTSGDILSYDYVSSYWAQSLAGTAQAKFLVDADLPILSSRLFVLGLKAAWIDAKGMDGTKYYADFSSAVANDIANDKGGGQVVSMSSIPSFDAENNASLIAPGALGPDLT